MLLTDAVCTSSSSYFFSHKNVDTKNWDVFRNLPPEVGLVRFIQEYSNVVH